MLNASPITLLSSRLRLALATAALGAPLLLGAGRADAGVTLVIQHGANEPSVLYLDGDRIRMENGARVENGARREHATSMIVDAASKRIIIINEQDKTYTEHTDADMKRIREQLESRRAQMEERMKTMPPEQRKQMEDMMAGMGAGPTGKAAKPRELKFESLGQKKTINGFSCDMYRVLENGKPAAEDCIAPWSSKLVQKSDIAGLRKFAEEMAKSMGPGAGGAGPQMFEKFDKYPGFPVSHVSIEPGQHEEDQLKSVKRGALAASLFVVPAGYTKKETPGIGAPGGPGPRGPNLRPLPPPKP
jgi:hypothetical protein